MNTEFYVYAGYHELYISSEEMPEPYAWQATFDDIDEAIEFAEEIDDYIIYCDNVRNYLPNYFAEAIDERHEWFNIKTGQLC